MPQRFILDRSSFEQFLSAASFLQQFERQALQRGAGALDSSETLISLVGLQNSVEAETIDLDSIISRLVKLTPRVVGADGAALWLFRQDELAYSAGTSSTYNSENLRLRVLCRLVAECHLATPADLADLARIDSGDYPGSLKALLVAPVYSGSKVAGALTAFSAELGTFADRDTANLCLLAKLLSRGLGKAVEEGLRRAPSLERTTLLRVLETVAPALGELAGSEERSFQRLTDTSLDVTHDKSITAAGALNSMPDAQEQAAEPREIDHINPVPEEAGGLKNNVQPDATVARNVPTAVPDFQSAPVPFSASRATWGRQIEKDSAFLPSGRQRWLQHAEGYREFAERTYGVVARDGLSVLRWARNAGAGLLRRTRLRLPLHAVPGDALHEEIHSVRSALLRASLAVGTKARAASQYRIRVHVSPFNRLNLQALRKPAGAGLMLAIVAGFLAVLGSHKDVQMAAASSEATRQDRLRIATRAVSERQPAPSDLSHGRVTDEATAASVHESTRFEIASLRRQAGYGDDAAAFQLGMSYETGHGVPQSCVQAAQWVLQAARDGNAAAEYNLGLRYRDGDGVPADRDEAASWLRKASAHKYRRADAALAALASPQPAGP